MDKVTLSQKLNIQPESLNKALYRLGISSLSTENLPQLLSYYAKPTSKRSEQTVLAAKELLQEISGGNILIFNDNRRVKNVTTSPLVAIQEIPDTKKMSPSIDFVKIASSDKVVLVLAFSGAFAIALAITAPSFIAVGINTFLAYTLSIFLDVSAFVFMCRDRYTYGVIMAFCTAIQAALTVGAIDFIDADIIRIIKGFTIAVCIGIVIHGYSSILANR